MQEWTTSVSSLSATATMILNTYLRLARDIFKIPLKSLELDTPEGSSVESLRLDKLEGVGFPRYTLSSTHLAQCGCAAIIRTVLRISPLGYFPQMEVMASDISGIRRHTEIPCRELSFQNATITIADSIFTTKL